MTDMLTQLSLRQPLWLLLAVIPIIALGLHRARYQLPSRLKEFAEPHLWRWLITPPNHKTPALPWLLIIAWLLATIALSGPYLKQPTTEAQEQRGMDIAVIIDISPSMKTRDVFPDRLERAKLEMQDFTGNLRGDRTALIAFSANAYKILPLTHDRDTLLHFIKSLDVTLTRKRGSNLTQALELAQQTLAQSHQDGRGIVLISDGESDDKASVVAAAQRLKKEHIPVYIAGVGTEAGGPIAGDMGRLLHHDNDIVISRLERSTLISLATISGGVYTDISHDNSDWELLFSAMDRLERANPYQTPGLPRDYPLFPWLLGLSIIFFIWSGARRIDAFALLLLTPLTFSHDAQAASWQEQKAYQALINKEYDKANIAYEHIETFNGQLGLGAAAYRLGEWRQAIAAFSRARELASHDNERAKAAYNMGNAFARSGDLDQASAAFEDALALQRHYPHAALNLNLVNKARLRMGADKSSTPKINPDAPHSLSDRNARRENPAMANNRQEQAGTSGGNSSDSSATQPTGSQNSSETIAQWNLGDIETDEAMRTALWQLRTLDESSDALLRARFTQQDAQHPDIREGRPW